MRSRDRDTLVDRFREYDRLVEIGIGQQPDVATVLADHAEVSATDIVDRPVPASVAFVRDDVTDPDPAIYAGADLIYAINLPPELHRSVTEVAAAHGADCAFTTFGSEGPAVSATSEGLGGERLYWPRIGP